MVVGDTASMMDELAGALLTLDFGQVWARSKFRQHALQNRIRLCKSWFTKSHTTLGKIGQDLTRLLGNLLYKIAYDFVSSGLQNRI